MPVSGRLSATWNFFTAASVIAPNTESAMTSVWPLAIKAFCSTVTREPVIPIARSTHVTTVASSGVGNGGVGQPRLSGLPSGPSSRQPATFPDAIAATVQNAGIDGDVHGVMSFAAATLGFVSAGTIIINDAIATARWRV